MAIVQLYDVAYARSGDKGPDANIGIIAYTQTGYNFLLKALSADLVQDYFKALHPHETVRYELPNLTAFNFILKGVLDGGGSRSLRIDAQGKALGQILLLMPLEVDETLFLEMKRPCT